jgi:hypothetical protein
VNVSLAFTPVDTPPQLAKLVSSELVEKYQ